MLVIAFNRLSSAGAIVLSAACRQVGLRGLRNMSQVLVFLQDGAGAKEGERKEGREREEEGTGGRLKAWVGCWCSRTVLGLAPLSLVCLSSFWVFCCLGFSVVSRNALVLAWVDYEDAPTLLPFC